MVLQSQASYIGGAGNPLEDFARDEMRTRPDWVYVDHRKAWACEYEPEARVPLHLGHIFVGEERRYRCALRTWLAINASMDWAPLPASALSLTAGNREQRARISALKQQLEANEKEIAALNSHLASAVSTELRP